MDHSITQYFQQDNKALGKLFSKLSQLQQWNKALADSLEENAALAQHCFIVNLQGTSLIVLADNAHWVTRFRFHIPALLPKLRNYAGLETIRSICCKVQPLYSPVSSRKARAPQQKLSAESATLMRDVAEKVTDEKLRVILEKIAERSL